MSESTDARRMSGSAREALRRRGAQLLEDGWSHSQVCDNKLKQQAIDRTAPTGTPPGRYRPPDKLISFLDGL